jgi:hypothetical protein
MACAYRNREDFMPVESILVSIAVASMFIIFAGVLLWGDLQTRPARHQTDSHDRRQRTS